MKNFKFLFLFILVVACSKNEFRGSDKDLKRLEITGACQKCDLKGAKLSKAGLRKINLVKLVFQIAIKLYMVRPSLGL